MIHQTLEVIGGHPSGSIEDQRRSQRYGPFYISTNDEALYLDATLSKLPHDLRVSASILGHINLLVDRVASPDWKTLTVSLGSPRQSQVATAPGRQHPNMSAAADNRMAWVGRGPSPSAAIMRQLEYDPYENYAVVLQRLNDTYLIDGSKKKVPRVFIGIYGFVQRNVYSAYPNKDEIVERFGIIPLGTNLNPWKGVIFAGVLMGNNGVEEVDEQPDDTIPFKLQFDKELRRPKQSPQAREEVLRQKMMAMKYLPQMETLLDRARTNGEVIFAQSYD